jgi:ABC-type multidrug transport system ATPase subunit
MSEELLKAILQLFATVAKERVTEEERANIKEFLGLHLNQDAIRFYLKHFDELIEQNKVTRPELGQLDSDTAEFVDDWSKIMKVSKKVNEALTSQQKTVLLIKIIELVFIGGSLSERQGNLIYYLGEALKIPRKDVQKMRDFVTGQDVEELSAPDVLIIDEGSDDYKLAGPRIVAKNLTGLIAILRLSEIETYFIKYLGISSLTLNGIALKSRKIDVFPTGSNIRGSKIEPIYYSDIVGRFLTGGQVAPITFTVEHLFYHFKSGRAGLQNINMAESGGRLVGMMGASGSGKSTLLSVLNGSEKPSSGRVIINGIDIHAAKERMQGVIGFIPQDDLLIEDLTVFQNLYFAARQCFGHYSKAQVHALVEKTLLNLGLSEIKHLKVGSPLAKTISGGQRKRVNIGLELLREPTVLFVDEPTSGLSSRDSENIMDLLKELSLRGKMVFVVIHQPSSDIFKMFDTLLILDTGGFQIYYGNPVQAVEYFHETTHTAQKTQGVCPECGNINPEQIFNIIETRVVNEYGRLTHTRKISPGQWYTYFKEKVKIPKVKQVSDPLPVTQRIPNRFKQLKIFIRRDVLAKLANRQYMLITLLEAPLLALFMGYMVRYYKVLGVEEPQYTFYGNDNVPVYFFMSVVVALFFGLTVSAEEIFRDRRILKRERFLHLSRSSYLLSKVVVLFTLSAIQTLTFILVGNWIVEIPLTEYHYWLILFSSSCFSNMLGLNISSSFNSAVTIYILIPLLLIPQLLLSGVVVDFDKFNPDVGKPTRVPLAGDLMPSRWAYEAYMVAQYRDNPFARNFYDIDKRISRADFARGLYIGQLQTALSDCFSSAEHWNDRRYIPLRRSFDLLRNEIGIQLKRVPTVQFGMLQEIDFGRFSYAVHDSTKAYLARLSAHYTKASILASEQKERLVDRLSRDDEMAVNTLMHRYSNRAVTSYVTNSLDPEKVVTYEGRVIQKIDPIFQDVPEPVHFFDFRGVFFRPVKYFAGRTWDTVYFNLAVIWVMTLTFFVMLYFDVFRRIIVFFENRAKYGNKK